MRFAAKFSLFLLPAVVQGVLSAAMLPLTTYVLNAEDYGFFALLSALSGFGTALAGMGASYTLAAHFPNGDHQLKTSLISTSVLVGLTVGVVFSLALLLGWPFVSELVIGRTIPRAWMLLALMPMLLGIPWVIAADTLVLLGDSKVFATVTILQSIAGVLTTILCLFILKVGVLSLFWAAAVSAGVTGLGGLIVLRPYLRLRVDLRRWAIPILRVGPVSSLSGLAESFQATTERSVLSASTGLQVLGVYSHSQQYRQLVALAVKAITRSVWPATLEESRAGVLTFETTGRAWRLVHVMLTLIGVGFALVGREVILNFTHNKLTAAYPFVALWMVLLLVKHSGRAELGFLIARGYSGFVVTATLASIAASVPVLLFVVPRFGAFGAVGAMVLQDLLFRVALRVRASSLGKFPFQDQWVVAGSVLVAGVLAVSRALDLSFRSNLILLLAIAGPLIWQLWLGVATIRDSRVRAS